jgi:hypothetical protein
VAVIFLLLLLFSAQNSLYQIVSRRVQTFCVVHKTKCFTVRCTCLRYDQHFIRPKISGWDKTILEQFLGMFYQFVMNTICPKSYCTETVNNLAGFIFAHMLFFICNSWQC